MDPLSDRLVIKYKLFKQDPLYFVRKFPDRILLIQRGKKLKFVVMAAALYEHEIEKLKIDWSKK